MRAADRFRAGSIAKPFVAVRVLQLAERGRLSLDARLPKVLPASVVSRFPGAADISVRMLLGHRSGIPEWDTPLMDIVIAHHPAKVWTIAEKLDLAAAQPPVFAPLAGRPDTGGPPGGGGARGDAALSPAKGAPARPRSLTDVPAALAGSSRRFRRTGGRLKRSHVSSYTSQLNSWPDSRNASPPSAGVARWRPRNRIAVVVASAARSRRAAAGPRCRRMFAGRRLGYGDRGRLSHSIAAGVRVRCSLCRRRTGLWYWLRSSLAMVDRTRGCADRSGDEAAQLACVRRDLARARAAGLHATRACALRAGAR
jgi:hypothetical protein